jgi:hypothetical protein
MMLVFLTTFLAFCLRILRSRAAVELENLALRHQIDVFQRSAARRPKLTLGDVCSGSVSLVRLAGIEFWRGTGPACIAFRHHYGRG